MPEIDADRNLLFGILALQMDMIRRDALIGAMNAWVLDKRRSLGEILQSRGDLAAEHRDLLEPLVQAHLKLHGNNAERSLAAVGAPSGVAEALQRIADPDLHASLAHAMTNGDDPEATTSWAV